MGQTVAQVFAYPGDLGFAIDAVPLSSSCCWAVFCNSSSELVERFTHGAELRLARAYAAGGRGEDRRRQAVAGSGATSAGPVSGRRITSASKRLGKGLERTQALVGGVGEKTGARHWARKA